MEVLVQYRWQGPSRKVLIVDDDQDIVDLMAKVLGRDTSLTVLTTTQPEEAISMLRDNEIAVFVCPAPASPSIEFEIVNTLEERNSTTVSYPNSSETNMPAPSPS